MTQNSQVSLMTQEAHYRLAKISEMELNLLNGKKDQPYNFADMMAETRKFLTITKPIQHKPNFNNNQII